MKHPKFQARHYEEIAAAIARTRMASAIGNKRRSPEQVLSLLVSDLACQFGTDNPNFDPARFRDATGL